MFAFFRLDSLIILVSGKGIKEHILSIVFSLFFVTTKSSDGARITVVANRGKQKRKEQYPG